MSRRIDGYRMYQAKFNDDNKLSDLFNIDEVWDSRRPSKAELYDLRKH